MGNTLISPGTKTGVDQQHVECKGYYKLLAIANMSRGCISSARNKQVQSTLEAYQTQLVSGNFFPVYYGIEVTRHCNFACIMCPNSQYSNNERSHMDMKLYKKIINPLYF